MNKYIKINTNNEIIDVFFDYQKNKFDGTEIFFEDTDIRQHKINNKSISNEFGVYIFTWDGTMAVEKTQAEIDDNVEFIVEYKKRRKAELFAYMREHYLDDSVSKTADQIRTRWGLFKSNASSWTTKVDVDDAFETAIAWLHS